MIKDWIGRCEVTGRAVLEGLGQAMVSLIGGWIARCEVSWRITNCMKYVFGCSGSGYGQFDKGLDCETRGFWKDCHLQEIWSWWIWVGMWSV